MTHFHTDIVSFPAIQQQHQNFDNVISIRKLPHCSQTYYNRVNKPYSN